MNEKHVTAGGVVHVTLDVPPQENLETGGRLHVSFLPGAASTALDSTGGLLAGLGRISPDLRERAAGVIPRLRACEPQVMGWLRASPENAHKYALDPIGGLKAAGVDPSLVAEVESLGREIARRSPRKGGATR